MNKYICQIIFGLILSFSLGAAAQVNELQGLDQVYIDFLNAETSNSYQASDSTVNVKFRATGIKPFKVGYVEVPIAELNIELSQANDLMLEEHFYTKDQTKIRFFIHPDSEHLYKPLINKYGYKGFYNAVATASTRTVLAWDPLRPDTKPLFLKLSLAQIQDQMGRIIPGWEVRRSVRITETVNQDIQAGRINTDKVEIIPEVAGAYVKNEAGMKFHVDIDQGLVSEHGFILRDASFLEKNKDKFIVPMFWLFSKGAGQEAPIFKFWRKSRYYTEIQSQKRISFNHFVVDYFFKPFIRQNLPLMLFQGIVPQIHGQNVVLVIDPETGKIDKIFHRDIGSMKVDYRLRWIKGLPIDQLRTELADKDFGLSWGAEQIEKYHISYLHDWLLRWGYLKDVRSSIKNFDPDMTRQLVYQALSDELNILLKSKNKKITASEKITEYINQSLPKYTESIVSQSGKVQKSIQRFIELRESLNQSVDLPFSWSQQFKLKMKENDFVHTDYGVIYNSNLVGRPNENLKIAFYDKLQIGSKNKTIKIKANINFCGSLF